MNPSSWIAAVLAAGMLIFSPGRALACSVCGCGDPLLSANDPASVSGTLRLQISGQYLSVSSANDVDHTQTDRLDQYGMALEAVYRPLASLSFIGTVPVWHKALSTSGTSASNLTGIGDVELGARYVVAEMINFAEQRRQAFAVSAGTSFPTGNNDAMLAGERVDEHGQLGTGSFGPYFGLHYQLDQSSWRVIASVSGRVRTTNGYDYRYGSAALWSVHAQQMITPALALELGVDGRYAAPDRQGGGVVDSTGGTALALAPGVYWNVTGGFWLMLRGQVTLFSWLLGRQSLGPTAVAGVQYVI
jgi:hypothetical protein